MAFINEQEVLFSTEVLGLINIDHEFDPESENPQSGVAIEKRLADLPIKELMVEDTQTVKIFIENLEKGIYFINSNFTGTGVQRIQLYGGNNALGVACKGSILIISGDTVLENATTNFKKGFITIQNGVSAAAAVQIKCGILQCTCETYEDDEGNEQIDWTYEVTAGTILTSNDRTNSMSESGSTTKVPSVSLVQNMIDESVGDLSDTRDLCAPALIEDLGPGFAFALDVAYEGSPITVQFSPYSTKTGCKAGVNMCRPFMTVDDNMDFESGSYMHYYEAGGTISIKKEVAGDEISFSAKVPLPAGDYFFGANQDTLNNVLSPYITVTNVRGETTHYGEPFHQYGYNPMCEVEIKIHIPADVVFESDWLGSRTFYPQFSVGKTAKKWEKYIEPVEFSLTSGKGTTTGIYPTTTIFGLNGEQMIDLTYSRSLISAYNELRNAIISLGGNV